MAIGTFSNFIGLSAPATVAATTTSQNGDFGLVNGDSVVVINESSSTAFVLLSETAGPVATLNGVEVQMIPAGGWGIVSRKSYPQRYYAVILATGTGNVRLQTGFGG